MRDLWIHESKWPVWLGKKRCDMTKKLWRAGIAAFLSITFGLLFLTSNSPLYRTYGGDSSIFVTLGRALLSGKVPYVDIFDHKGPMIFFINAFPQLFSRTVTAVWVQEVVLLFFSLLLIARMTGRMELRFALPAQLVYLAFFGLLIDGGNYTEEYCNFFTLLGLSTCVDYTFAKRDSASWVYGLVLGLSFSLCFMTRVNNALGVSALTVVFALALGWQGDGKGLARNALSFLIGCVLVFGPILLYLGLHDALDAFYYAAFEHNLLYAGVEDYSRKRMLLSDPYGDHAMICAGLCALGAVCAALTDPKNRSLRVLCIAFVGFAAASAGSAFISHKGYLHYLLPGALSAVMGAMLLERAFEKESRRAGGLAAAALCAYALSIGLPAQKSAARAAEEAEWTSEGFEEQSLELLSHVPVDERDDILGYRVEHKWYVVTDVVPARRIFFMQEILGQANPAIMDEVVEMMRTDPPKWLVMFYNRAFSPPYDARVVEIIEARYEQVATNDYNQLLRLKDD